MDVVNGDPKSDQGVRMENAPSCKSITPQQDAAEAAPQDRDDDFLKQTAVMSVILSDKSIVGIIYLFLLIVNTVDTKK